MQTPDGMSRRRRISAGEVSTSNCAPTYCSKRRSPMQIIHRPPNIFEPIGPYAQAIEATSVQRLLFISGTMGLEPNGLIDKDFQTQATRVWANIDATLISAGMSRKNLAKLTIWLANTDDWKLGAEIRQRYLGDHKVAMSVVQVGLVHPDWLIEVEAVAVE